MKTDDVNFSERGLVMKGVLAYDETQSHRRPGVLVIHEAWGLARHTIERAKMLAGLGYVSLAADLFGGGRVITDVPEAVGVVAGLRGDPATLRARVRAALNRLARHPQVDTRRMAAIGYCFGGSAVLEVARDGADIAGVVSFHGGLPTVAPAAPGALKAKVLVCTGAEDPYSPIDHVTAFQDEMRRAGADWQVISYGATPHSFTNPDADGTIDPAIRYHELSDKRSWAHMRVFLDEIFRSSSVDAAASGADSLSPSRPPG